MFALCTYTGVCRNLRIQGGQFHRRLDKWQSWHLETDLVAVHTVWSVSRRCTWRSDSLSVLSVQSTTLQIRHRSV